MRFMRSLEYSFTSKQKSLLLFFQKPFNSNVIFKHQCQLYRSTGMPFTNFLLGKDTSTLAAALSFSENMLSPILSAQIHACIFKVGFSSEIFVQNNLIKAYAKTGALDDAFNVFDEMPQRNPVSWTLLISGATQCGKLELSLEIYLEMMRIGPSNEFAIGSAMKACANLRSSVFGLCVHCCALKMGIERNPHVGSSILTFYAKLGNIKAAESIFKCMDHTDTGCWNAMIGGYAQCGYGFEAMSVVSLMRCKGVPMDRYTFISAFQGCSLLGDLNFGRQLHGVIVRSAMEFSTSVMNALMDMYFKNDTTGCAFKVLGRMCYRDVVTLNTVLGSFSQFEDPKELVHLFYDLASPGTSPNHITFSVILQYCGKIDDLDLGLQFYCLALHFGFFYETKVTSSVIYMFSRCGAMEEACLVFDNMGSKDVTNWNELISGYSLNCCEKQALQTFCNLLQLGVDANEFTFSSILETCYLFGKQQMSRQVHGMVVKSGFASYGCICSSLIKCYVKFGLLNDSFEVFNGVEGLDMISWGNMISMLVHQGYCHEAIAFFKSLLEAGEKPDEFIFGSILNSCAAIAAHRQTRSAHAFISKLGFDRHVFVASAVLDAYAKCGDIEGARMAFEESCRSHDVVTYNAMIMAYAHHSCVVEAMETFEKMKFLNKQPSQATFVSLISACGHMGLVGQGCFLFGSMKLEHRMEPRSDIYGCMVDMFARNGYLEDAKQIIETMPYSPWPAILRCLLSGCRIYGNREVGEWAAKNLLQLLPEDDAAYALLFKVYTEGCSWDDAANLRRGMAERDLKKDLGCSWIEA